MLAFYLSLLDTEEEKSKLEKLYIEYKSLMKFTASKILSNEVLAEDAVHDAFIKLTRYLDGIEEIISHKTKSFVVITVRNIALDMLEKEKKIKSCNIENIEFFPSDDEKIFEKIEVKELCGIIDSMSDTYRDIIWLKVYYDLSDKQIADILGISHSAARKRLQRARNTLLKMIKEAETENAVF